MGVWTSTLVTSRVAVDSAIGCSVVEIPTFCFSVVEASVLEFSVVRASVLDFSVVGGSLLEITVTVVAFVVGVSVK